MPRVAVGLAAIAGADGVAEPAAEAHLPLPLPCAFALALVLR
jgi:hypothetical protein